MAGKEKRVVRHSLERIAIKEGKTVSQVRKEIEKAMFLGLLSHQLEVKEVWAQIPKVGEVPTVEEAILYFSGKARGTMGWM